METVEEFVRGRIKLDYVQDVAAQVRSLLIQYRRSVEVAYMPGDATFYGLVFTPLNANVERVGDRHAYQGVGARSGSPYKGSEGWVQVALVNWERVHVFPLLAHGGCYVHYSSVIEHLCDNEASAVALAELFNRIGGATG